MSDLQSVNEQMEDSYKQGLEENRVRAETAEQERDLTARALREIRAEVDFIHDNPGATTPKNTISRINRTAREALRRLEHRA